MRLPDQSRKEKAPRRDDVVSRRTLPVLGGAEPTSFSRRDFLTLAGFAFAGAAVAGCQRAPIRYAKSYVDAPAGLIPGRTYEYSSTCGGCSAGCGLVVRDRDGRPIKLEGNPDHPLSRGGLCAAGQASLLGLYDQQRLAQPLAGGQPAEWPDMDQEVMRRLENIRQKKGAVRFLTGPGVGPTARASIRRFLDDFADNRHVVLDPRSCSAIREAHARTHGARVLPHYRLDAAEVIVGIDADFLGSWISPVEFTAAYQAGRRPDEPGGRFSYHVQFEPLLTLTGAKADQRLCVAPAELGAVIDHLVARLTELAKKPGLARPAGSLPEPPVAGRFLDKLAASLWQHRRRSVILCGGQEVDVQVRANVLNHLLDNYGATVALAQPSYQRDGDDREVGTLLQELQDPGNKVQALFVYQCNPVHDLPGGDAIAEDLKRVPLLVSLAPRLDETAQLAGFVCPDHHYLEGWGDAEPVSGTASLVQPAINPLGNTRSVLESLAAWTGKPRPAYEILRERWEKEVYPRSTRQVGFTEFWDRTLLDGFAVVAPASVAAVAFKPAPAAAAGSRDDAAYSLVLYSAVGMPDASHAYNPWLHELPDPVSKVVWDNYAAVSPAAAEKLGVADGDLLRIEAGGDGAAALALELPVRVQMGQHDRVVGIALGYGSVLSKRFANIGPSWLQAGPTVGPDGRVGVNAAPLLRWADGGLRYTRTDVRLSKASGRRPLAATQGASLLTLSSRFDSPGREREPIIREQTLQAKRQPSAATSPAPAGEKEDLWPADHPAKGARWGMVIDLAACTGCSACVVACQAENNVPVVGKDEVGRHREMHWLRIDRYYTEQEGGVDVALQPMLCQQCGNAPCETVCPVLATVHSDDGLNQQVYNRCVGTRYCANNCPYKVRRFNWFDYAHDDLLQNLALNPDVTVRSRGVMEKCTFCVHRIEDARAAAGGNGKLPADGVIQTACQQSCPAGAIVFGDLNDPASRAARLAAGPRGYQVLAELNVKPSVTYLAVVRNRPGEREGDTHG